MIEKRINWIFVIIIFAILVIPLVTTNFIPGKISEAENRYLTPPPLLFEEYGVLNRKFFSDTEKWLDDNIGFRNEMVKLNAKIQYDIFHHLEPNSEMTLGPKGEFNYVPSEILRDYQHFNLHSEEKREKIVESYQTFSDDMKEKGIQYYYMQCWDKHSIYPEEFPKHIFQYGQESKTDQVVRDLQEKTDIHFIPIKEMLIEQKAQIATYTPFGDPSHWSRRGAYLAYLELMGAINAENEQRYPVLQESDYDLELEDNGQTILGSVHEEQLEEKFTIKAPKARITNDKLTWTANPVDCFYTNDIVGNDTRVLMITDSYLHGFLLDDIAESFRETVFIWADATENIYEIVEAYQPDIIINENAERSERFESMVAAVEKQKCTSME